MTIPAIILCAGISKRMGRPKPLLRWEGGTFFDEVTAAVAANGLNPRVAVIAPSLRPRLPGIEEYETVVENDSPERGQLFSLQMGLKRLSEESKHPNGVLVLLIDNPGSLRDRVKLLLGAVSRQPATLLAAGWRGVSGHPVYIPRRLWQGLLSYEGEGGARGYFDSAGEKLHVVETCPAALRDVDTPDDFDRLRDELNR